jgi:hypothetical protein
VIAQRRPGSRRSVRCDAGGPPRRPRGGTLHLAVVSRAHRGRRAQRAQRSRGTTTQRARTSTNGAGRSRAVRRTRWGTQGLCARGASSPIIVVRVGFSQGTPARLNGRRRATCRHAPRRGRRGRPPDGREARPVGHSIRFRGCARRCHDGGVSGRGRPPVAPVEGTGPDSVTGSGPLARRRAAGCAGPP